MSRGRPPASGRNALCANRSAPLIIEGAARWRRFAGVARLSAAKSAPGVSTRRACEARCDSCVVARFKTCSQRKTGATTQPRSAMPTWAARLAPSPGLPPTGFGWLPGGSDAITARRAAPQVLSRASPDAPARSIRMVLISGSCYKPPRGTERCFGACARPPACG
jgi:hypothetical protein